MITRRMAAGGVGALLLGAGAPRPTVHTVRMLNRSAAGTMVFEPGLIRARIGDTVRFMPTDPSHNAELIRGMTPAGVPMARGAMNKMFDLRVTHAGLYGVKCSPHFGMGMVALIVAGDARRDLPAFRTATARLPVLSRRRMEGFLRQAGEARPGNSGVSPRRDT